MTFFKNTPPPPGKIQHIRKGDDLSKRHVEKTKVIAKEEGEIKLQMKETKACCWRPQYRPDMVKDQRQFKTKKTCPVSSASLKILAHAIP